MTHWLPMSDLIITGIQANLVWENPEANRRMLESTMAAITEPTQLLVLPEMFSTGFTMHAVELAETMDGPTIQWMRAMAKQHRFILTGSLIIREGDAVFNRLLWVLPTGDIGYYNKRHLFAFAGEHEQYTAGQQRFIASVNGWKVNLQICYDLRFPVWSRQQLQKTEQGLMPEFDLLIYVANWPERRSHAWKSLLVARAIENQCYVLGVNRVGTDANQIAYSGDSMLVGPLGDMIHQVTQTESTFTCTLQKAELDSIRRSFPFLRDADSFSIFPD
jgi:omega-amidase